MTEPVKDEFESPLKFPNPKDYATNTGFNIEDFSDEYISCLIELGIIIDRVYDPILRKKLESLMRGVEEWLE